MNLLLFTDRHFGTESAVRKRGGSRNLPYLKCEATANSVTGHVCVNSNVNLLQKIDIKKRQIPARNLLDRYPSFPLLFTADRRYTQIHPHHADPALTGLLPRGRVWIALIPTHISLGDHRIPPVPACSKAPSGMPGAHESPGAHSGVLPMLQTLSPHDAPMPACNRAAGGFLLLKQHVPVLCVGFLPLPGVPALRGFRLPKFCADALNGFPLPHLCGCAADVLLLMPLCGHKPDCFLLAFLYGRVRNDFRFLLPGGVFPPASVLRGLPMLPPYSALGEPAGTRAHLPLSGGWLHLALLFPLPANRSCLQRLLGSARTPTPFLHPLCGRAASVIRCHALLLTPRYRSCRHHFPIFSLVAPSASFPPVRLPPVVHSAMTDDALTSVCLRLPALPLSTLSA